MRLAEERVSVKLARCLSQLTWPKVHKHNSIDDQPFALPGFYEKRCCCAVLSKKPRHCARVFLTNNNFARRHALL